MRGRARGSHAYSVARIRAPWMSSVIIKHYSPQHGVLAHVHEAVRDACTQHVMTTVGGTHAHIALCMRQALAATVECIRCIGHN